MKKQTFITLFIAVHCTFIIVQIHKQSTMVKNSYEKQRLEREYKELMVQLHELEYYLARLQNPETIKQFAQSHLAMKAVEYKQIKVHSS